MKIKENKNIVILGPTSSGKTGMAVKMAYDFSGEVISADSRQVYRGMDIGTGKDLCEYEFHVREKGKKKKIKIPYHLIDVVGPNTVFDLAKFVKGAKKAISDIHSRERLPIIAGGTGLYTQALVDGYKLTKTGPDRGFRAKLETMSVKAVYGHLKRINKDFAQKLNESEKSNKRRLIRYIEMEKSKDSDTDFSNKDLSQRDNYLLLGVVCPRELLYNRINQRLKFRLEEEGMIKEIEGLHKNQRVSWARMATFGLEYKYVSLYLQNKINYEKMFEELDKAIRHFAKRQMSWYRRWERDGAKICWVNNYSEAKKLVKEYLK